MKIKAGIIGTGNIGTDLLVKCLKSDIIEPIIFCGRRNDSDGILKAKDLGVNISNTGIDFFKQNGKVCDVVFDCTNAFSAIENYNVFKSLGIKVIDLTPAKLGELCVPTINIDAIKDGDNVNMITCGGQASIPLLNVISKHSQPIDYIEVVSQISSKSAGIATRVNIDQYILTTEYAIKKFTGCKQCKVILNLNPANPCVDMQTTMFIQVDDINFDLLLEQMDKRIKEVKSYVPSYAMTTLPVINDDGILILNIKVKGSGDYLPSYAGNLDIINCAALKVVNSLI